MRCNEKYDGPLVMVAGIGISTTLPTMVLPQYVGISVNVGVVAGFMTSFLFCFNFFLVVLILLFGLYDHPAPYLPCLQSLFWLVLVSHPW